MPRRKRRFRAPVDGVERLLFGDRIPVSERVPDLPAAPRYTAAERRIQILEAVVPVFASRGYARATVSRLEAVVPVSRPTMYGYFPSKARLYAAALEFEASRVEAALLPVLEGAHAHELVAPVLLRAQGHDGDGAPCGPAPTWTRASATSPSALDPASRVVYALARWARRNPDSVRLLLQRPIDEPEVVGAHAAVRARVVGRLVELLRRDPQITAQRGLQRRFALQLHAEMLVGAAEAVLLWALEHPLVPAVHLARTWTAPPRGGHRPGRTTAPPGRPGAGGGPPARAGADARRPVIPP